MKLRNTVFVILLAFSASAYGNNFIRERAYLHTDKQTYLSGELLWMKFYLVDEKGKPSSLSKVGYVELVNESSLVQIKLEVTEGTAEGWMELPVTLPTGNYRLIAYTTNMRNEGESVFFNKTIGIINTFRSDAVTSEETLKSEIPDINSGDNITVSTNHTYSTRNNGEIQIGNLPDNIHSVSISVAGKDFIHSDENIHTWSKELNNYNATPIDLKFLPEYEGHIINGKVSSISSGLQLSADRVFSILGFVGDQIRVFGGDVEDNKVRFFTKRITGTKELAVSTMSLSGNQYRVDIETPFAPHSEKEMPALLLHKEWENELLQRSVGMQVQYAYNTDLLSKVDTSFSYYELKPDRSYILDEYTRFTRMDEIVIEFIPVLRFRHFNNNSFLSVLMNENSFFNSGNTLVLLDGIPILDHRVILNYNPLLVRKIDVYRDYYVFANRRYEGMVSFTTYNKDYPSYTTDETTHLFNYEGTQQHRYFYSPSYNGDSGINTPDYRHTLLWMPDVKTNGDKVISIPFCTSDLTGDFQVTVEGITKDGKTIRGTCFFKVSDR
jgi:Large extracellular alpha-helical protein